MTTENALAAGQGGTAPALQSQEEIRRLIGTSLPHLAQGSALLQRCWNLQQRTPRDSRLLWLAARVITADSILGKRLAKAVLPPRRKAKRKRLQNVDAELNSHFAIFHTPEER